jgi:predicted nucleic acid-binding protein
VKYWDASAIVPLFTRQTFTEPMEQILIQDGEVITWWGSSIECYSALMRLVREGKLNGNQQHLAEQRLTVLQNGWEEVVPTESVRRITRRLLRTHPLRAADALQLAAALTACEQEPDRFAMVCLDSRLAEAAHREGFVVLGL